MKNTTAITENQLDEALNAWEVSRETAVQEQLAWGRVSQSHNLLIKSLRKHGHTWAQAQLEFEQISNGHSIALLEAWKAMDARCSEYMELLTKFKLQ